ncbi:MAG: hypothetical protein ABSD89_06670 [Halobacteriota archaeon]
MSDDEHHEEDDFSNNFSKNSSDEEPEDSLAYVNRKLKAGRLGVGETLVLQQKKMAIRRAGLRKKKGRSFGSVTGTRKGEVVADQDKLSFERADLERFAEHRKVT